MMPNIITPINEFPNYMVTDDGKVFSKRSNQYLNPFERNGYLRVTLCNHQNRKTKPIHRIVAITYIQNPNNLSEVNHIDGDKHNNKIENLEWVSRQENVNHRMKNGLHHQPGILVEYHGERFTIIEELEPRISKLGCKVRRVLSECNNCGEKIVSSPYCISLNQRRCSVCKF